MKVGEYVRTKKGSIAKVLGIDYCIEGNGEELSNIEAIYFDNVIDDIDKDIYSGVFQDCLKEYKSSPNIIDLIEVGDYVNGYKVSFVDEEPVMGKFVQCDYEVSFGTTNHYRFYEADTKLIVTHEQFSQMEYRIKE